MVDTRATGAADVFQAIANPTRRALLGFLRAGETPAMQLANQFDLTQAAISQQLRVLREAGLVAERRVGRQRLYHLNPSPLRDVADWLSDYERFWHDAFDRLGAYMTSQRPQQISKTRQGYRRKPPSTKGPRQ